MDSLFIHYHKLDASVDLLRQVFGPRVTVNAFQVIKDKPDYLVQIMELRRPDLTIVLKLAGPQAPLACSFDRSAALYRLVAEQTTLTMPEIFAVDVSYATYPWRYMIKSFIPGKEWGKLRSDLSPAGVALAFRSIGLGVAQVHQIRFPSFGEVNLLGETERQRTLLEALRERAQSMIRDLEYYEFFLSILETRASLFTGVEGAGLCHEDLHGANLLLEDRQGESRLVSILDFDKAWAGHVESDLARLDLWRGMSSPAFWDAYRQIHQVSPLYVERRPVYQLLWCLECAWPDEQHRADTQAVCRELGVRLPKDFE